MSDDRTASRTLTESEESRFVKRCRLYRDELANHPDPALNNSYALAFEIAATTIETLTKRLASSYDNEIAVTEENERLRAHLQYHCAGDGQECGFDAS